jgi:hypothetical protein
MRAFLFVQPLSFTHAGEHKQPRTRKTSTLETTEHDELGIHADFH